MESCTRSVEDELAEVIPHHPPVSHDEHEIPTNQYLFQ
jgi:hypothetical protein